MIPTAPVGVVFYESNKDPIPVAESLAWEDLAALLTEVRRTPCAPCPGKTCPHKFSEAWSPVILAETCQVGARCKDARHPVDPDHPPTRANDNVLLVTAAVLDFDNLTEAQALDAAAQLDGLRYIAHTTHSHRPEASGGWSLRAVVALSRPVPAADWRRFLAALVAMSGLPADPTCKDLSRLYFLPTCAEDGAFLADQGEGEPIDVDAVLAGAPPTPASAPAGSPQPVQEPVENEPGPVDLGALRDLVKDLRTKYLREKDERADLLTNLLEGNELVPPGQGQDAALHRAVYILATKLPPHTPAEAAVEILRRSINAMGAGPEGIDHWFQKAAKQYEEAHAKRLEADARVAEANARLRSGLVGLARLRSPPGIVPSAGAPAADASTPGAPDDDEDAAWGARLIFKPVTKDGEAPKLVACDFNAWVVLSSAPEWKGHLRFNDVRREVEVIDLPGRPAPIPEKQRHLDVLPRAVANWLHEFYGIDVGESAVASTLLLIARENLHDPVREYLEAQSKRWDGVNRLETFLETYCKASVEGATGTDIREHVRRVSAKWLISAAARGLEPGCKVDTVLILESPQGRKKSSLFEVLGGEWYAIARVDVEAKDSLMVLARSWIVELAELSALRKSDTESARAFFSTRTDLYRLPYGRAVSEVARRCVFAGTTNPTGDGYLSDRTGNRRYWPVTIEEVDLAAVRRDRDQIFAEAALRAKEGLAALAAGTPSSEVPAHARWWLEGTEAAEAEAEAADRATDDEMAEVVHRWWASLEHAKRPLEFTTVDVAKGALPAEKLDHRLATKIGQALRDLGFGKRRGSLNGGTKRIWLYLSTPELRAIPHVALHAPRSPLTMLARPPEKAA